MKLDEFITQTLISIVQGVKNAQNQTKDSAGVISPHIWKMFEKSTAPLAFGHENQPVTDVTFDVVVTTSEKAETQGGLGIFVGPIGAGSKGALGSAEGSESRIQFKVPVILPYERQT